MVMTKRRAAAAALLAVVSLAGMGAAAPQTPAGKVAPLRTGPPRLELEYKSPVSSLAWSRDGRLVAVGTKDGTVHVHESATGKEVTRFPTGGGAVVGMSFAPGGKMLALGQAARGVRIWDVDTGKQLRAGPVRPGKVELLAFTPDGQVVMSVSVGNFSEWRLNGGGGAGLGMSAATGFAAIAPDGSVGGWAQTDGAVLLREYEPAGRGMGSKQVKRLQVGKARCIAFGPGGKLLAVGGDARDVVLWDLATRKQTAVLTGLEQPAARLAFSTQGNALAALAADGRSVRVWDLARNATRRQINHPHSAAGPLALSPDGKVLAATGPDNKVVVLWNVTGRQLTHKGPALELSATDLAGLWADLASRDGEKADAAWRKLGAAGDHAIGFLRKQIRPIAVPAADTKHIEKLVAGLDADEFATREKATQGLLAVGELAVVPLQRLLEKPPSLEAKRRAESVLEKLASPKLTPEQRRVLEAIELLEQLRTDKAVGLLREIERDALVAPIRTAAHQALQRLAPPAKEKK